MTPDPTAQLPLDIALDVEARFETYFAGDNAPVIAALASPPAPGVWLTGPRGSGRSHLLQAAVADVSPGYYLPMRMGLPAGMTDGLAASATVCLDDVEMIAGDSDWERALMSLYERLLAGGGRLIVSATDSAERTGFALPDLESRCQSLARFRLQLPDDDGRLAALIMRAESRGLVLPEETARYLLVRLPRDLSTLFDWLARLDEQSLAANRRLTVPFVRQVLQQAMA